MRLLTGAGKGGRLVRKKHHLQKGPLNTGGPGHDGKMNADTFSLKMKEGVGKEWVFLGRRQQKDWLVFFGNQEVWLFAKTSPQVELGTDLTINFTSGPLPK